MARSSNKIDAKGRVAVPARLRNNLGGLLYVTLSLDPGYLAAYTAERFEEIREQINALNSTEKNVRELRRIIIGEAIPCELDAQGRISVSDELWAEIGVGPGEEIYFIDLYDKLEICAKRFHDDKRPAHERLADLNVSSFDVKGL